jgi:dephospho-CoA kinase
MQSSEVIRKKPHIVFMTGVSGAGKTTLLKALQERLSGENIEFLNFDSVGVPTEREMIINYGSGAGWQKATLDQWVEKILHNKIARDFVILDGQVNLEFIKDACQDHGIDDYSIVLVHCDHHIRHERLNQDRKQPELINTTMDNWANFLKQQAIENKASILDSTNLSINQMVKWFISYIHSLKQNSFSVIAPKP